MQAGRRGRTFGALAVSAALAVVGAGCTGDDGIEVVMDDGTAEDVARRTAMDNAYGTSSQLLESSAFGGLGLEVEYFEPLRKGEWVAPDHCTFSTRVSVDGQFSSPGFNGPGSDDDREAGEGALVGTISTVVAGAPTSAIPDDTVPASTLPPEPSPATVVGDLPPSSAGQAEPTTTIASSDGSDVLLDGSSESIPPDTFDPGAYEPVPVIAAIAVVFGHDQVVELSSDHPAVLEGHGLIAQPLDGWNLLRVSLDPEADLGANVPATLRRIHEDGTETSEQLEIPVAGEELLLLNDDWQFDLAGVDESCEVPDGSVDNEPTGPDTDIFGSPVGDAPSLPEPGPTPPDPAAAADEALRSLRAVYDLSDIYADSKRDHVENPEDWDLMRRQLIANDVVAPYMSKLDPEFRSSVFVSPTEMHVLYRVGPSYQWEIGRVLLIDGRWRVAAGTVCRDLSAAGYSCPGIVNDPRPGPLG